MSSVQSFSSYYGMGTDYANELTSTGVSQNTKALQDTLQNGDLSNATDKELMDVCKSFESYFVEQVLKEAKKTIPSEEDEGEYMEYFGDMLVQEYAEMLSDNGSLGIAQTLYDSMKRNGL